jgi:hypothetical protein
MDVTFLTTAFCNGHCKACSVRPWMNANKGYQMSMKEVSEFVFYSKKSGYKFGFLGFAGGEPLLWKHLVDAAKVVHGSGIADKIQVITNGLAIKDRPKSIIEVLNEYATIKVSRYVDNAEEVKYITDNFDDVLVADCTKRGVTPVQFIEGTLPADCMCQGIGYTQGTVTPCGPVRSMGCLKRGMPLMKHFLNLYNASDTIKQPCCQACVANKKIHKHIEFIENTVKVT